MMKKLLIILLVLFSTFIYAESILKNQARDLDYKIADLIVDGEKFLKKNGYKTFPIAWSATYKLLYHSPARFFIEVKKGCEYVFYTMTTGPGIKVCLEKDNKFFNWKKSTGSIMVYRFISNMNEEIYYRIEPISQKNGLHVSYFTEIIKEK